MTLEEFKQDCLRKASERRTREEADRTREREDIERLRATVMKSVVEQGKSAIPGPLQEFVVYDGDEPGEQQLKDFRDRWIPTAFKVEAPGLLPIRFSITTTGTVSQVKSIVVGVNKFGDDWIEAVAAAVIPIAEEEMEVKR